TENRGREAALARIIPESEDEGAAEPRDLGLPLPDRAFSAGQLDGPEVLAEGLAPRREASPRVEGRRAAVEDETVVAAGQVAADERDPRRPRAPSHQALAQPGLPLRPRRGRDVDVEVEPARADVAHRIGRIERVLPERLVVPDVFADRHADPTAGGLQDERARSRLDVTSLVEHVVGGQEPLVIPRDDPAVARGDGRVEDPPT